MNSIGWDYSAPGWIDAMGESGDATRRYVLDAPMLTALPDGGDALDIGCGEGRFCRMMQAKGLTTIGIDPTEDLIEAARSRDPAGTYQIASGESLPFDTGRFDVSVFYLSLIDIPDFRTAIAESVRVLRSNGTLLIANLHDYTTARPRGWTGEGSHWVTDSSGQRQYLAMDDILLERSIPTGWGNIRIENHHRPLSAYMTALLDAGLVLKQFSDPPFTGPDGDTKDKYTRMPWAFFMSWAKP